jgi:type I restriction enzyme, S subunit
MVIHTGAEPDEPTVGWAVASLFDICNPQQWPTIPTKLLLQQGYPVYGANGQIGFYSQYNHERPTVLMTCRGATCGTLQICKPFSYVTGNAMCLDDVEETVCDFRFLLYALKNRGLDDAISGSAQPQITRRNLEIVDVPLAPLAEQHRIVAALDKYMERLVAVRDRLAQLPAILKRFRQAVLAAACSGRMTEDWRTINKREADDWPSVSLGNVADLRLGKMLDQKKNLGSPTPYIRNVNVRWFFFDTADLLSMRATEKDKSDLNVRDGDLLVCEGGEPGRCAVWNLGPNQLIFQKAIHRVRLNPEVLPHWVAFNLKKDADSGQLEEYFTGSGIRHLTGRSLEMYSFPLPLIDEQTEIVRRVQALFALADAVEKRVEASTQKADKITQSILAKAFRGELVPTEAELARREGREYEPASVLLERIKAERVSQVKTASRPKRKIMKASAHVG